MYNPYNDDNQNGYGYDSGNRVYTPYDPPEPKKKSSGTGKIIAVALVCSLLGGVVGAGAVSAMDTLTAPSADTSMVYEGDREPVVLSTTRVDTSKALSQAEIYAQNVNSTVGITTSVTTNFWGYTTTQPASGSGFIYTDDGYILTNHHVIEGASSVTVSMYDGTTYDAVIVGYDESNDIAVLKIDAQGLTPVVIGNSDTVNVGDNVVAIGNPLGELTFSLTAGVVSALDREVTFSNGVSMDLIQTDCAINSGNSGGALFNMYGEVIGITNAKYSSSSSSSEASIDNIGFAIPMNTVRNIVDSLIENGYISKPYIGVSILTVSEDVQSYGLPAGASVQEITAGSPAEQAGLQINDIITKADDTEITTSDALVDYVGEKNIGDTVVLTIYRNGQTMTVTITIGENISSAVQDSTQSQSSTQQLPQSQQGQQYFGGGSSGFPWFYR